MSALPDKQELPDQRLFDAIGRLCSAWANLEFETEQCIWGILKINKATGKWITWQLDMRGRWNLLNSISKEMNTPIDHDFIKELGAPIVDLNRDRNTIVHGLLLVSPKVKKWSWVVFRGTEAGKPQPATIEFVTSTMEAIQQIAAKLHRYNQRRGYAASPFDF